MNINELFNVFEKSIKEFFPQLVYDTTAVRDKFIKRFSKYNGTEKKEIEFLPNIFDDDVRLLNTIDKFMKYLSNKYDNNTGFDGITYIKPYRIKDINRLKVLMSAPVEKTIANPILGCAIIYADEFYDTAERTLTAIKSFLPKVNINDTIRKRKNSSSGSFFGISTHDFYMRLFNIFKLNVINGKWDYIFKQCNSTNEIFTQPLTRRMDKAPKTYFDMTTSGKIKQITRELDDSYNNISRFDLYASRHRFVNNVSEVERMFHLFYNLVSDTIKYNFSCSMVYDRDYIDSIISQCCNKLDYYDLNAYIPIGTDGSAFDKHVPEKLMHMLEAFYSSYYSEIPFLSSFRKRKRLIFPGDKRDEILNYNNIIRSLQDFCEAHNINDVSNNIIELLDNYGSVINLDSGKSSVSFDGKLVRIITDIRIIEILLDRTLDNDEIIKFLKNKFTISIAFISKKIIQDYNAYANSLQNTDVEVGSIDYLIKTSKQITIDECEEFIYRFNNSSDDHLSFGNRWFALLYLFIIKQNSDKQKDLNTFESITSLTKLDFLPVDLDGEYLSMVFVRDTDNKIVFTHNSMRRFCSMLKPEHGVKLIDGYKDFVLGLESRVELFSECVDGEENFKILDNLFIEEFNNTYKGLVEDLSKECEFSKSELPEHIKATLTEKEKLLLSNLDYIYYKIDPDEVRPELLDYLFFNIDINDLYEILTALNVDYVKYDDFELLNIMKEDKQL